MVTSPQSGDVIALVGGRRVGYNGFDRALDATRPMGSLVKPFVYLTALETKRYTAASVIQDEPIDVRLRNGTHWRPENFTKEIYGPVPLVRALSESLNLATVGLGLDVGLPNVTKTLQRFGLRSASRSKCRRCCSARSTSRPSKWRRSTAGSRTAGFARRCAQCAR